MHSEQCPLKPSYAIKTHVSDGTKCGPYFIHPFGVGGGGEMEVQLQGTHSPE
jgi:hypothetical protein